MKRARAPKRPFHHGNLHEALVERARALLRSDGLAALSLREVARREGVSHAAAYRHFRARTALLAAVATTGFVALRERLEAAVAEARTPLDGLGVIGASYVRFAFDEPHLFRLMYGPELAARAEHPALETAAREAFGVVPACVREAQQAKQVRREPVLELALIAWSLVHGIATLALDGQLADAGMTAADAERFVERADRVLRRGLLPG